MKAVKLDADGDIEVVYGRASLVEGGPQVAQRMRQRFETVRGEWPYDRTRGIPLYDEILLKGPLVLAVHAIVVDVARKTPGATAVEKVVLDLDADRRLTVDLVASTKTDTVKLATVLGG